MRTSVNPGSWVELRADLVLDSLVREVIDRESGANVSLYDLLTSFRVDPDDPIIGRVRITIVPEATVISGI